MSAPDPYYQDSHVSIFHGDSRDILPHLGHFDLLLTDPPYGIGADKDMHKKSGKITGKSKIACRVYPSTNWDAAPASMDLIELARAKSRHHIIFGGNYYALPATSCWLVWDKQNDGTAFADCELAWTNLPKAVRMIRHRWSGMLRKHNEYREHPTQKPLDVMAWCIMQAPPDIQTILDPFMGSGTTLRAAKDLGRKAVGIDSEEMYCEMAARRMLQEVLQLG